MADLRVLAEVDDYVSLLRALIARRHELGLSQADVDAISGLPDGYVGKVECFPSRGGRGLGGISLGVLLGALGVRLALVEIDGPGGRSAA